MLMLSNRNESSEMMLSTGRQIAASLVVSEKMFGHAGFCFAPSPSPNLDEIPYPPSQLRAQQKEVNKASEAAQITQPFVFCCVFDPCSIPGS